MKQTLRIIIGRYYITDELGLVIDHGSLQAPLAEIVEKLNPESETEVIIEEFKNVPR